MKAGETNIKPRTVIVVAGPTAVGKTAVALQLAQHFNTSIISADSRQCYREISIGTAKPSEEELRAATHYFIDEFSVRDSITAADFERLGLDYLEKIFANNQVAIVCGGTGLYLKALLEGLDEMPPVDNAIEAEVNASYQANGIAWLQAELQHLDPVFFGQAEKDNPARLLRALAFRLSTGKSITHFRTGVKKSRDFRVLQIVLELPRPVLYERIDQRVDVMMQQGLLEEATALYPLRHLKNLQTVGYSELFSYMDGTYTLEEAVDKIKQHTRNYAKRQITWFKKEKDAITMTASDKNCIGQIVQLYEHLS